MTSFGTLFAFTLVCIAVWVMRKKEPNLIRPFKVPAYKIVVALGVFINIYLIFNLSAHALELSAVWLFLGGLVYFLYGKSNSKLNNPEKYQNQD
jgi:APA family basic amino acid/polyamine antiporter